ncbi:hypothetical protein [[Actinomadura] parvosata]|uniref:hypothetical protein n=1 Tax=[Actinomadura] parvosata TaxID=1955412 RepID=UPI001647886B
MRRHSLFLGAALVPFLLAAACGAPPSPSPPRPAPRPARRPYPAWTGRRGRTWTP